MVHSSRDILGLHTALESNCAHLGQVRCSTRYPPAGKIELGTAECKMYAGQSCHLKLSQQSATQIEGKNLSFGNPIGTFQCLQLTPETDLQIYACPSSCLTSSTHGVRAPRNATNLLKCHQRNKLRVKVPRTYYKSPDFRLVRHHWLQVSEFALTGHPGLPFELLPSPLLVLGCPH